MKKILNITYYSNEIDLYTFDNQTITTKRVVIDFNCMREFQFKLIDEIKRDKKDLNASELVVHYELKGITYSSKLMKLISPYVNGPREFSESVVQPHEETIMQETVKLIKEAHAS
ncbi:MAG: hypothetical protein [Caudoviricetes sp.]|nr:MAG: hypothetical protein [Caudoviricetes sp.]